MVGIEDVFKEMDEIEKEFDELWQTYNPDETTCNLNILYLKLCTIGYKYVAKSYEIVRREKDELLLDKFKSVFTILSWTLTGISAFVAAPVFLGGAIGSLYLSLKKRIDIMISEDIMTEDEKNMLIELLTNFDSKCSKCADEVADRLEYLDSDDALEEVKNNNPQDYNRRMASKLIVDFLYNGTMEIPNDDVKNEMISIIQKEYKTNENDFETLINILLNETKTLGDAEYKVSERARKLSRQRKSKFYN